MAPPRRSSTGFWPAAVGFVLASVVMTWPFVNYAGGGEGSYGGDMWLIVWTLAWDNHALLSPARLFDANVFFPAADALRYNDHLFGLSLFTLPLTLLGASPVLAHNVLWGLAFPLNGLTAFALLRRFVTDTTAAFAGSLVFTFSFYVMLHAGGHLPLIWLWPLPLSLLLFERWFDRPSVARLTLWVVVLLLLILTSWYVAVIGLVSHGVLAVVLVATLIARERREEIHGETQRESWQRRGGQGVVAVLIVLACTLPFARHYVGIETAPGEAVAYSADLASYLIPPENTFLGRWWEARIDDRPRFIYGEQTLFLGWTTLGLALFGLMALMRGQVGDSRAWVLPLLAVTGTVLSFGPSLPLVGPTSWAPFEWLAALPGLDGFRAPARFAVIATLGFGGLAACGAAALSPQWEGRGRWVVRLLIPVMLLEWFVVDFPNGKPVRYEVPAIYFTPEVQTARALVSLPEYRGTASWFRGGDYLYYATAHWRPIVNGFGRSEPPDHGDVIESVRAFPDSAPALRALGIQYVVVHSYRYGDDAERFLSAVASCSECRLVRQQDGDYLFELVDP